MRASRSLAVALTGLLALGAAACGDDDGGSDAADATTTTEAVEETTTTAEPTTTAPPATTTTVTDEGNTAIEQLAQSTLVTLDDLDIAGFEDLGYTPDPGPNRCGFDVDATHPAQVLVGTDLGNAGLRFLEEIRVYATSDDAEAAFLAGIEGNRCEAAAGTVVNGPLDVTERVGAQRAFAVSASQGETNVIAVVALISDAVMSFNFAGTDETAADAPDPVDVAALGVGKLKAVLEASRGN